MQRKLLIITTAILLLTVLPAQGVPVEWGVEPKMVEQGEVEHNITIAIEGNIVSIGGANGLVLEVVSLTGRHLVSHKIESSAQRVELNVPKGCYILKVGKVVRKVTVR